MLRVVVGHRLLRQQAAACVHPPQLIPAGPAHASALGRGAGGVTRGLATAGAAADDEAAKQQRRMEALKRFGVSEGSKGTEGKPVVQAQGKADGATGPAAAAEAEGKGEGKAKEGAKEEIDYNEIWKDYIWYMDHQRTQGWKS